MPMTDDWATVLDELIEEMLGQAHWRHPPVDAVALAKERLHMQVCLDASLANRGRAQKGRHGSFIYLRPDDYQERYQWTVAHEIGEHWRGRILAELGVSAEELLPQSLEELANRFAARLLVPTRWLAQVAKETQWDLIALKQQFSTASHEVIAWRTLDMPVPCIISVIDQGKLTQRRSNSWPAPRTLTPLETKCQRIVHERSEPFALHDEGWQVQGWPIHQNSWKREILRSTWEAAEWSLG